MVMPDTVATFLFIFLIVDLKTISYIPYYPERIPLVLVYDTI